MTSPEPPPLDRLRALVAALRHPATGCPWDLAQTHASLARYAIEEAHEVAEAAERGAPAELADELGDLLLQVLLHARLAEEAGAFDLDDVARGLAAKLVRRHPHVFGDAAVAGARPSTDEVRAAWEAIKAGERGGQRPDDARGGGAGGAAPEGSSGEASSGEASSGEASAGEASAGEAPPRGPSARPSALDGVPLALPALARALKLQERAARLGFDWGEPGPVVAKVREELAEVEAARAAGDAAGAAEEVGDLLFAVANLARHLGADPEAALRAANAKFARRFAVVERGLAAAGRPLPGASLDEMEAWWGRAKREEGGAPSPPATGD